MLSFEGRGILGKDRYQAQKEGPVALVQGAFTQLCREGKLIHTDGAFHLSRIPGRFSREQERIGHLLLQYCGGLGLVPFRADMFWKFHQQRFNKNEIEKLLDFFRAQDRLIRLRNDQFLTPEALEQIKEGVRRVIRH